MAGTADISTPLAGKAAVISGGSRGIGLAIAERLARDGADCLLAARDKTVLDAAAAGIAEQTGRHVVPCATDLRTEAGCIAVQDLARRAFPRVDILVHSAGATRRGALLDLDDAVWEDGFALKFKAGVRLARLFWPRLKETRGTVVIVGGGAARTPDADFMIAGAVNAALASFAKALSRQGMRDDVTVNTIHPGLTATERLDGLLAAEAEQTGVAIADVRRRRTAATGIRRLGEPEDVAALAAFLCSAEARHIQGTAISVDGGETGGVY